MNTVRRGLAATLSLGVVAALGLASTQVADAATTTAAAPPPLKVVYDASGTSHVAKTDSDIALGPTKLSVAVSAADGAFTGTLPLPKTSTSFKAVGLLPTTADVEFIDAGPVVGKLNRVGAITTVTSTATYIIRLSNVQVAGLPALVGGACQTAEPITVPANTPPGEAYDLVKGGHLTGTFTIGQFANCGLTTPLLNLLVPGAGNTVDLTVANGRLG